MWARMRLIGRFYSYILQLCLDSWHQCGCSILYGVFVRACTYERAYVCVYAYISVVAYVHPFLGLLTYCLRSTP